MIQAVITGVGGYLPEKVVKNSELESLVDTSDEWIRQRTGITQRFIANDTENTVTMGAAAAREAIANANISIDDIDLIILATTTPNNTFPSSATQIQNELAITKGFAFDIQAVCSGFLYALNTASLYIKSSMVKKALVIGSETFSRIVDWKDRSTCVLFGDGAGAVVLEAIENTNRGILSAKLRADGRHWDKLYVDGGPSTTQSTGHLRMQGREVFKFAVSKVIETVEDCLHEANIKGEEIDWFVPHQANQRIIEATAQKLNINNNKVISTVGMHGNTSAASIPLALNYAIKNNKIKPNDLVLLESVGGGFTWGAMLIRW